MSAYGYTTGYGFTLINYQTQSWQTEEYQNWRLLDGILGSTLDAAIPFAVASGSSDDFVVSYTPAITSYTSGQLISFQANQTITGPATVNVNGLGAKDLYRDGVPLEANGIVDLDYVKAIYDGTRFLVLAPTSDRDFVIPDGTIAPAKLTVGKPTWDSSGNLAVTGNLNSDGPIKTGAGASASLVFSHNNTALTSAKIFYSTGDPAGGSNGDIWFKHAA